MKIYIVKIASQSVVDEILQGNEFTHDGIYNFENDLNIGDPVIIYFGGDKATIAWDQGIRAIGKVTATPFDKGYDNDKPKNFKIKINPIHVLENSIPPKTARTHMLYAADMYEVPYIGASHPPNQAITSYAEPTGIQALGRLYNEFGSYDFSSLTGDGAFAYSNDSKLSISDFSNLASALQAKPFVILTGLSGSGKTREALLFSKWISHKNASGFFEKLKQALDSEKIAENYNVISCSPEMVKLVNKSGTSQKIIPLPVDLIEEWYLALKNGTIVAQEDAKDTRHVVGETSAYQKHMHGFYNELKKLGAALCELPHIEEGKPGPLQYEIISVGADWTSNENLLGYPDALKDKSYRKPDNGALALILRAKADPENPYFLILDEMNLSHVERYFADFLSAMESGEAISLHDGGANELWDGVPGKLKIPKNLFVVGTVNIDETTYMFSPKVLDRANVIEFSISNDEMKSFLTDPVKPDLDAFAGQGTHYGRAFVAATNLKDVPLDDETREKIAGVLMKFFPELKEAGAEFGYRTAHEICRFVYFHKDLSKDWKFEIAMDAAIMQKLLPKLHGSKKKLKDVLAIMIWHCLKKEIRPEKRNTIIEDEELIKDNALYPLSLDKLKRMRKRLAEHGFTSYAEA